VWIVFGSNAIVAYMFSELMPGILFNVTVPTGSGRRDTLTGYAFNHFFAHIPDPGWAAFAYSFSFTAFCFLPVWILYRKKIFLKV
jgi:predicted acyltransferase